MIFQIGNTVSSYLIDCKLGRGGNCEVYRVTDQRSNRSMALKVLLDDRNAVRFKREFRSMSQLQHPNIAEVYDFEKINSHSFFTMELIAGGDLKGWIRRTPDGQTGQFRRVPVSSDDFCEIAKLLIQICDPLSYIHSKNIIHRDLKPGNIMLTKDETIKLMDFGLIKELDVIQASLTQTGAFIGTVNYMSPEQGMCRSLDHRTDLYSLGVIIYEMLTGHLPFTGKSVMEVFMKHIRDTPSPPRHYNPAIPPLLEHLTMMLLQKEPAHRLNSAAEIPRILKQYLSEPDSQPDHEFERTLEANLFDTIEIQSEKPVLLAPGFIGRSQEMAKILTHINQIENRNSPIISVTGEMGVGKSRFLHEIAAGARMKNYILMRGICQEIEQLPFGVFLPMLENAAEYISKSEDEGIQNFLQRMGPILAQICPRFGDIPKVAQQPDPIEIEPTQDKLRKFDALKTLFNTFSKLHPIAILFEDIQWIDELSIEFIHYLARTMMFSTHKKMHRLFIVLSYRSDEMIDHKYAIKYLNAIKSNFSHQEIKLLPFSKKDSDFFIKSLLGMQKYEAQLFDVIYSETGGNPFFIQEVLNELIDSDILKKRNHTWIFEKEALQNLAIITPDESTSITTLPISNKVKEFISRRLERIDRDTMSVLSKAAVIGMKFDYDLLLNIVSKDEDLFLDCIDQAIKDKIVEEVPGSGGQYFRFHNQMFRHVVYDSLSASRRRREHRRVANQIIKMSGENNNELWPIIAFHFDQANQINQAFKFYALSAQHVFEKFLYGPSHEYSQRSLLLYEQIRDPSSRELQLFPDLLRIHGRSSEVLGDWKQAINDYEAMLNFGKSDQNKHIESKALYYLGGAYFDRGQLESALNAYQNHIQLISEFDKDNKQIGNALGNISDIYLKMGKFDKALEIMNRVHQLMEQIGDKNGLSMIEMNLGMAHYYLGKSAQALQWFENAYHHFEKSDNRYAKAKALSNMAAAYLGIGKTNTAISLLQQSTELSDKISDIHAQISTMGNLGCCYTITGNYAKSSHYLEKAVLIAKRIDDQNSIVVLYINLGNLYLELGDYDKAETKAFEAIELSSPSNGKPVQCYAFQLLTELYLRKNDFKTAQRYNERMQRLSDKIGLKPLFYQAKANELWFSCSSNDDQIVLKKFKELKTNATPLQDQETLLLIQFRKIMTLNTMSAFQAARRELSNSIKSARQQNRFSFQWRLFEHLGQNLLNSASRLAAYHAYRHSLNLICSVETKINPENKHVFYSQPIIQSVFDQVLSLAKKLSRSKEMAFYKKFLETFKK